MSQNSTNVTSERRSKHERKPKANTVGLYTPKKPVLVQSLDHQVRNTKSPNKQEITGPLGDLPSELRNKIYELIVGHPRKVRLPRKPTSGRRTDCFKENKCAKADGLKMFEIPVTAQVCRQMRKESLGLYYSLNSFAIVFSCRQRDIEDDAVASLRAAISVIGPSIRFLQPQAFEIRFLSAMDMRQSTLKHLAVCFATMHANGLKIATETKEMILSPSTCGTHATSAAPLRVVAIHLFVLGMLLARQKCACKDGKSKAPSRGSRRLRMFECEKDVAYQLQRLMLCKKLSRNDFLKPKIMEFMRNRGCEISQDTKCPDGCCP